MCPQSAATGKSASLVSFFAAIFFFWKGRRGDDDDKVVQRDHKCPGISGKDKKESFSSDTKREEGQGHDGTADSRDHAFHIGMQAVSKEEDQVLT